MPGKDVSSSTGKIFAKPSKEWVLPERAKPGRKASTQEPESKRQSQNRLSQRAHRARRTDYITTLEERLRKYEADEIHSNVRLQEVARALKGDNDKLKSEVGQLRQALAAARRDRETWGAERKALADTVRVLRTQLEATRHSASVGPSGPSAPSPHLDERIEYELAALTRSPAVTPTMSPRTSTASATRPPSALTCPICPDPDPDCPCQQDVAMPNNNRLDSTLAPANTFNTSLKCGMCELVPEACLCRDDEDVKPVIPPSPSPEPADSPDCGLCTNDSFCACRAGAAASTTSDEQSVPPVQVVAAAVAIPLRRSRPKQSGISLWSLTNVASQDAVCTGDPSNCDACRDDKFGQEFCGHLFGKPSSSCKGCSSGKCGGSSTTSISVASLVHPQPQPPAQNQPPSQPPLVLACCGAPELCGHAAGCDAESPTKTTSSNGHTEHETIRPDEAWKQLKAHPNARFTPLAVLADVVARRAKCDGPRVELSPPPEQRRLGVETSGVRDALKYLDTHDGPRKRRKL